jgi:ribosome-associated protein
MLVVNSQLSIPLSELEFSFARSPGPGGQNVNKVNSKAVLKWNFQSSKTLPESVQLRFKDKYRKRISKEGDFVLASHRYRDQGRNVADCLDKLRDLIMAVYDEPVKRKATKVSRAAKQRRLNEKRHTSEKKKGRSSGGDWS